jgi:D-arabinose 1-dehydrogenase-like Zn-dependent alcohol dehydrogenase
VNAADARVRTHAGVRIDGSSTLERTEEHHLELVERDLPTPGPGAVRVRVQACGVHSDMFAEEAAPVMCAGVTTYHALRSSPVAVQGTSGEAISALVGGLARRGQLLVVGARG